MSTGCPDLVFQLSRHLPIQRRCTKTARTGLSLTVDYYAAR
jgi:hypothetical protein